MIESVVEEKKLLVVRNHQIATNLKDVFGPAWVVKVTGSNLLGYHFSTVVLTTDWNHGHSKAWDWFQDMVASRLVGAKKVVNI